MIVICILVTVMVNVLFSLREVSLTLALSLDFMRHRAVSLIAGQSNLYGGFLSLYLFLFIALLMYYPMGRKYKLLLLGATCLVMMNLVYTMSRGAWLACMVTGLYITATKGRRLVLPIATLTVFVLFWAPDMATERWDSAFQGQYDPNLLVQQADGTEPAEAATRIVQWRSFLPMMAESPVFGIGYGRYAALFKTGGFFPTGKSAHSSIIEIGVEQGILGLFFYLWALWAIYRSGLRVFKTADQPIEKVLGLALLAATMCLFLLDLTGTRFRDGNIMAYFWILVGITANSSCLEKNNGNLNGGSDRVKRLSRHRTRASAGP
jgi:O-antigen ligase